MNIIYADDQFVNRQACKLMLMHELQISDQFLAVSDGKQALDMLWQILDSILDLIEPGTESQVF